MRIQPAIFVGNDYTGQPRWRRASRIGTHRAHEIRASDFARSAAWEILPASWDLLGRLGAIAVIRTFLNFFLGREIAEEERDEETTASTEKL